MKRLLIIFSLTLFAMIAKAETLHLSVEQFFDGRYDKEKTVCTSFSKDKGSCYRMLQIKDNPSIVKKIAETLVEDRPKATEYFENFGGKGKSTIVKIINDKETIYIGFTQDRSGKSATFFIHSSEEPE